MASHRHTHRYLDRRRGRSGRFGCSVRLPGRSLGSSCSAGLFPRLGTGREALLVGRGAGDRVLRSEGPVGRVPHRRGGIVGHLLRHAEMVRMHVERILRRVRHDLDRVGGDVVAHIVVQHDFVVLPGCQAEHAERHPAPAVVVLVDRHRRLAARMVHGVCGVVRSVAGMHAPARIDAVSALFRYRRRPGKVTRPSAGFAVLEIPAPEAAAVGPCRCAPCSGPHDTRVGVVNDEVFHGAGRYADEAGRVRVQPRIVTGAYGRDTHAMVLTRLHVIGAERIPLAEVLLLVDVNRRRPVAMMNSMGRDRRIRPKVGPAGVNLVPTFRLQRRNPLKPARVIDLSVVCIRSPARQRPGRTPTRAFVDVNRIIIVDDNFVGRLAAGVPTGHHGIRNDPAVRVVIENDFRVGGRGQRERAQRIPSPSVCLLIDEYVRGPAIMVNDVFCIGCAVRMRRPSRNNLIVTRRWHIEWPRDRTVDRLQLVQIAAVLTRL